MPPTVNRSAVVVTPKQPFLDWLHRIEPANRTLTLEQLGQPTVYLLPECDDEEVAFAHVRHYSDRIFEEQLESWWQDPEGWPADRDFKTFSLWFEYRVRILLFDLCEDQLRRD